MMNPKSIISLSVAFMMMLGVVLTAHAAPGGNNGERLDKLEMDVAELRMALDVTNLTEVEVTRYISPGAMVAISVFCPAGTMLRGRSWNIRGTISDLPKITNDHDKTDLSGVFIRAHGGVSSGSYLDVTAICGPEIVE